MAAKAAAALEQHSHGQDRHRMTEGAEAGSHNPGSDTFQLDRTRLISIFIAILSMTYWVYSKYYVFNNNTAVNINPSVASSRVSAATAHSTATNVTELPDTLFNAADWKDEQFMTAYQCDVRHKYSIAILNKSPLMMYITGFLQPGEADHLKYIAHTKMERSFVYGAGGRKYAPGRTSKNAFLVRNQDKVVACIEARTSSFSGKHFRNIEELQVVHYGPGEEYKPHYDYFVPEKEGAKLELSRGGQREITFFTYLNNVPDDMGGETVFPNLGFEVLPKKNDAVFWYNTDHDGREDPKTYHSGAPIKGQWEKWGLNIWIRHGIFL